MADLLAARVYARLLVAQARAQAQYRTSFAVDVTGSVLAGAVDLVEVVVLFRVTRTLGGFDFAVAFLMATMAAFGFAIADLTVGSIERMRVYVRMGLLDTILIRPLGSLWQLLVMDFAPRRAGRVLTTGVLLAVATARAQVHWNPERVALVVVAVVAGAVLFGSVFVATASVAFWWIDSHEFANSITYGGSTFTSYPITVYGRAVRGIFGYGLGYAFVGYYPVLTLLDHRDPLGMPTWVGWCSPLVALLMAGVASLVWRTGIRHYRSTGS